MSLNPNAYAHLEDDAAMIQAAVDDAAQSGERVEIPRRNARTGKDIWILPRAIRLYSGSTVILDNCHLRLADGAFDNIFKNSIARTEEAAHVENRQYDICIAGMGNAVLDGGNHNGLVERNAREKGLSTLVNTLIHFHNAQRIVVENLRMVNARYWGMTFHFCSHGRVSNLHFQSCGHCPNQDGIDLRLGCCDFLLENITGYTQDDSIALTCLNDAAIQKVAGMDDSIHNVIIRNIATNSLCANVRLLNHYGRKLYNVIIENVQSSVETDPAAPDASAYALRMPDAPKLPWAVQPFTGRPLRTATAAQMPACASARMAISIHSCQIPRPNWAICLTLQCAICKQTPNLASRFRAHFAIRISTMCKCSAMAASPPISARANLKILPFPTSAMPATRGLKRQISRPAKAIMGTTASRPCISTIVLRAICGFPASPCRKICLPLSPGRAKSTDIASTSGCLKAPMPCWAMA